MNDLINANIEERLQRLERRNRVQGLLLVALLCTSLTLGSIAASNAAPTVLTAEEFRAHSFSILDPGDVVVAHWFSDENGSFYTWGRPPRGWKIPR